MKTKCPHCQQNFEVPDVYKDRPVKCASCGEGFTVQPINAAPIGVSSESGKGVAECPYCRESIIPGAIKCKHCQSDLRFGASQKSDDKLELWQYPVVILCALLIPFGWLIAPIYTIIMYRVLRNDYPNKAKSINRLGFLVILGGFLLYLALFMLSYDTGFWGSFADGAGNARFHSVPDIEMIVDRNGKSLNDETKERFISGYPTAIKMVQMGVDDLDGFNIVGIEYAYVASRFFYVAKLDSGALRVPLVVEYNPREGWAKIISDPDILASVLK